MSTEHREPGDGLERARFRRHDLRLSMEGLERALTIPASSGWVAGVQAALGDLGLALRGHVDEVEGPAGLLAEMRTIEPRLGHLVDDLRSEHRDLLRAFDRLQEAANDEAPDLRKVRRRAVTLLGRLALHRQAGADLVYEVFQVDIGGQG